MSVISPCHLRPGTYALLENKLSWAPGSIDAILAGGEPKELVVELRRSDTNAPSQGYTLRPTNANALSLVSTEELLLELPRRIIAPRERRHDARFPTYPQAVAVVQAWDLYLQRSGTVRAWLDYHWPGYAPAPLTPPRPALPRYQ